MLRFGPEEGPVVVAAPALFEEANRTRAFLVRTLRLLGDRGVAGALPDLPGQGESVLATADARLTHWRSAFAAAVAALGRPACALALRGGALVDGEAVVRGRYHLSPVDGASLLRDMERAGRVAPGRAVLLAGNELDEALVADLRAAEPSVADRVVRLDTDPRPADLKLSGPPLWRRSEPDVDEALAVALADDIAAWVRRCAV